MMPLLCSAQLHTLVMPLVSPPVLISVGHPHYRGDSSTALSHSHSHSSAVDSHSRSSFSSPSAAAAHSHSQSQSDDAPSDKLVKKNSLSQSDSSAPSHSRPPLLVSASLDSSLPSLSSAPERSNIFFLEPVIYSSPLYGNLYADSEFFDDRNFLSELSSFSHIVEIRVWSREFIHGIQILYEIDDQAETLGEREDKPKVQSRSLFSRRKLMETPVYRGSVHTTEYQMKINHRAGEFVIGVEGTFKEWIESLTIVTNKQKQTFGSVSKNPAYGAQNFICDVPQGHRVLGFQGCFGMHLHAIGVFHQPVSREDLKYHKPKDQCMVKKILSYFR